MFLVWSETGKMWYMKMVVEMAFFGDSNLAIGIDRMVHKSYKTTC